jgi:hypothetical protein
LTTGTSGAGSQDIVPETYRMRLRAYERRERTTTWVGAGLLGLVALSAGNLAGSEFVDVPSVIKALLSTLVILSGAFLAQARIGFEWESTKIKRREEDEPGHLASQLSDDDRKWPGLYGFSYNFGILLVALAGLCALVAAWWPVGAS